MARRSGPSEILRYSHLGIQFAVVVLAAIWVGNRVDRRLATRGIFTLIGTFLGAGIGFYLLTRELGRGRDPADRSGAAEDSGDPGNRDAGAGGPRGGPDGPARGE